MIRRHISARLDALALWTLYTSFPVGLALGRECVYDAFGSGEIIERGPYYIFRWGPMCDVPMIGGRVIAWAFER